MIFVALLAAAFQDDDPARTVATVLGRKISAADIELKEKIDPVVPAPARCGVKDPVSNLIKLVWRDVACHAIEAKGLKATPEELGEILDRMNQFAEENRKRRARELSEVEGKLKSMDLSDEERRRHEDRLKTLQSLADLDRWEAAHPKETLKTLSELYAPMVEAAKLDAALHREFGGVVAVTKFGQVPVGARAALLRKYVGEGRLEFSDKTVEKRFWAEWDRTPKLTASPDKVDLTPYWKLPAR